LITIIAEAGINHCGSLDRALKMVEVAADAGANVIKFQSFTADKLGYDEKLTAFLKGVELSKDDHHKLKLKADKCKIEFMSTPFSAEWVDFLVRLGVKRLKISSGKVKDKAFVDYARATDLPLIISNGMTNEAGGACGDHHAVHDGSVLRLAIPYAFA
jgi:N,N'-diacetyllegionaminate synthase